MATVISAVFFFGLLTIKDQIVGQNRHWAPKKQVGMKDKQYKRWE